MELKIYNFTNGGKVSRDHICLNHCGYNKIPKVTWKTVANTVSYALIFEDPNVPGGTFIHWFLPYISPKKLGIKSYDDSAFSKINSTDIDVLSINEIKKMTILHGKNSTGAFGYHGPCVPEKLGEHHYIFTIYALDGIVRNLSIKNSADFEEILLSRNISILCKESKQFRYSMNKKWCIMPLGV